LPLERSRDTLGDARGDVKEVRMMLQDMVDDLCGVKYASSTEFDRAEAAKRFIERCGYAAAAVTLAPIPLSDAIAVMPIHVGMIMGLAQLHGVELTKESAAGLVVKIGASAGLSLVSSRIATAAAKILLPGLGGLLGAPFMYASTIAIGSVARIWFDRGGKLTDAEICELYKDALRRARATFDPRRAAAPEAKTSAEKAAQASATTTPAEPPPDPSARLAKLRDLLEKGLIEPAEYEATKKRILDAI
jgi:uncharacterized protein (DUF697 family)